MVKQVCLWIRLFLASWNKFEILQLSWLHGSYQCSEHIVRSFTLPRSKKFNFKLPTQEYVLFCHF